MSAITRGRPARALLATGASLALLLSVIPTAASPASATTTRTAEFTQLADVDPGSTGMEGLSNTVVDTAAQRAYVADRDHRTIVIYDTSSNSLTKVATLTTGFVYPLSLAIDPDGHRLFVGDFPAATVTMFDVDPNSPTRNTPIRSFPTGGVVPSTIRYDNDRLFASHTGNINVAVVDLTDSSVDLHSTTSGSKSRAIAIDHTTHVAYVAMTDGILTIRPDGSETTRPTTSQPRALAVSDGNLFIAGIRRLDRLNLETGNLEAGTTYNGEPYEIAVDARLGLVYVSLEAGGAKSFVFRSSDLTPDGSADIFGTRSFLTIDDESRVYSNTEQRLRLFQVTARPQPSVHRVAGVDRYAGSAAVSAESFAPNVAVAYVASGEVFPDALSAGAAAGAQGAPVLLVQQNSVAAQVKAEIGRLKPGRIVVLGGKATISDAVVETLGRMSMGGADRVGGNDRYEVSAAVSKRVFNSGVDVAYVASGETFPDALSGSAVAGLAKGPILLVRKNEIPAAILAEISRLAPKKVIVLGGVNSVSDSVLTELNTRYPTTRIAGADRYSGSAALSAANYGKPTKVVYVASGVTFPDALSGGAAAVAAKAPVLLVNTDSIPAEVRTELDRLDPFTIVVLGGTNTVTERVLNDLREYLTP